MTKLIYFICQLIIGWIERCNHAYKDESVSVNATDETQPVKVRWTAEQIKPKRYGKTTYLPIDENLYYWTFLDDWQIDNFPFLNGTAWFIDIPGAPEELKPLKYPENRPDKNGWYLVHNKHHDKWDKHYWGGCFGDLVVAYWDNLFDYFIPYRLEE